MLVSSIAHFNAYKAIAPVQIQKSANSFNGIQSNANNQPRQSGLFLLKSIKSVAQKLNVFA